MGNQTTVIIRNDGLGDIRKNAQQFVDNLYEAIQHVAAGRYPEGVDISAGSHGNPARVVECHHADNTVLVAAGGSTAGVLTRLYQWRWNDKKSRLEDFIKALRNERDAQ